MRRKRRVLLWGVLLSLLAAGVGLLLLAQRRQPPPDTVTLALSIVDERGTPAGWADVILHESTPAAVREAARWDRSTGVFSIPVTGAPHRLRISGPGFKTTDVEGIRADARIEVEQGFPLQIDIEGDLPRTTRAPRILMVRITPEVTEADPKVRAAQVDQITRYMMPMTGMQAGSMPLFETQGFGFTVSAADAAAGLRVPQAGRYRVDAGLLEMHAGMWQEIRAESLVAITANRDATTRAPLPISAQAFAVAERALDAQLAARRAQAEAGGSNAGSPSSEGERGEG